MAISYSNVNDLSAFTIDTDKWNDALKRNIRLRLMNSKLANKDNIPTKLLNDLSICLCLQEKQNDIIKSYILTDDDIKKYGVSAEEMFKHGIDNLSHDRAIRIMTLKQYLMRDAPMFPLAIPLSQPITVGNNPMAAMGIVRDIDEDTGQENILCICNKFGVFGAAYLACPEILDEIYNRFGENYYVLPLSIHALMCVRHRYATHNDTKPIEWVEDDLLDMIADNNDRIKDAKDILSYRLYYYLGDDGKRLFPIYN